MRLYNFIVKYEIKYNKRLSLTNEFDRDILEFIRGNLNAIVRVFGDNMRSSCVDRFSNIEMQLKYVGEDVRNRIKNKVDRVGLTRPASNWYRTFTGRTVEG